MVMGSEYKCNKIYICEIFRKCSKIKSCNEYVALKAIKLYKYANYMLQNLFTSKDFLKENFGKLNSRTH